MIDLLILEGAEVNVKDDLVGETPLHRASENGRGEVITALLAAGADKTIKADEWGRTPHRVAKNQECKNALR